MKNIYKKTIFNSIIKTKFSISFNKREFSHIHGSIVKKIWNKQHYQGFQTSTMTWTIQIAIKNHMSRHNEYGKRLNVKHFMISRSVFIKLRNVPCWYLQCTQRNNVRKILVKHRLILYTTGFYMVLKCVWKLK